MRHTITAATGLMLLALASDASCGDVWPTGHRRATSSGLRLDLLGGYSGGDASGPTASVSAMLRYRFVQAGAFATVIREGENPQVYAFGGAAGLRLETRDRGPRGRLDMLLSSGVHRYPAGDLPFLGTRVGGAFEYGGDHVRFSGGLSLSLEVDLGRIDPSAAPLPCADCRAVGGYVFSMLATTGVVFEL